MYFSCNFSISSTLRHLHILIVDPVQCNFLLRLILCWNAVVVSTKKITLAFFLLYQHTYTKAFYIWWHFGGYEMGSLLVIRIPQYTCTIAYKKTGIFVKAKKKKYILQLKYIRGFHSHPLGQSLQKKNTIRDGNYPKLKQGNLSKFFHQN